MAVGFDVAGAKHLLMNNRVLDPLQYGFHVHDGSGEHVLQGNVVASNGFLSNNTGFEIVADGNRLKNNRAQGHRTRHPRHIARQHADRERWLGQQCRRERRRSELRRQRLEEQPVRSDAGLRPIARFEGDRRARRFGCRRRQVYVRRVAKRITMAKRPLKLRLHPRPISTHATRGGSLFTRRCGSASKACSRWSVDVGHGAARQA